MMSDNVVPDIIFGIDFGHTCTGVAYCLPKERNTQVSFINAWPHSIIASGWKIPTLLRYNSVQDKAASSWGFESAAQLEAGIEGLFAEYFKTKFDDRILASTTDCNLPLVGMTKEHVKTWTVDFLRKLYDYIKLSMCQTNIWLDWDAATIVFDFSIPTTWPQDVVESFYTIAKEAGFGASPNHSHSAGITEPEAVAIHVLNSEAHIFQPGDVVLVCDAGGGSTDLCAFQIESQGVRRIAGLMAPTGIEIGSVMVDRAFELRMVNMLQIADKASPLKFDKPVIHQNPEGCAFLMARSREFVDAKHDFGDSKKPKLSIPITGLSSTYRQDSCNIANSEMAINDFQNVLEQAFFPVTDLLIEQIDKQLEGLAGMNKKVNTLILSGGLGRSAYVRQMIKQHHSKGHPHYQTISDMKLHVAITPQLAVCRGIVVAKLNQIRRNESVMSQKCCNTSYGLMELVAYDSAVHGDSMPSNEIHQKGDCTYIASVEWLIRKGEPVSTDRPIVIKRRQQAVAGHVPKLRLAVVTSPLEDPPKFGSAGTKLHYHIKSKVPRASWQKYLDRHPNVRSNGAEIEYEIRAALGDTYLNFELWFDGQRLDTGKMLQAVWDRLRASHSPVPFLLEVEDRPDGAEQQIPVPALQSTNNTNQLAQAVEPEESIPLGKKDDERTCCCTCM